MVKEANISLTDRDVKDRFDEVCRKKGLSKTEGLNWLIDFFETRQGIEDGTMERLQRLMDKYEYSLDEALRYLLELQGIVCGD